MAEKLFNEGLLTANRISELREQPVEGQFDTAHLKEVHRHIFQDLDQHAPGEFRVDRSQHMKTRSLEDRGGAHVVGYMGSGMEARVDQVLGELRDGDAL
ncbi:hypothetical protein [Deinococcus frigens]|uniref:hypothetical protein n=1 Tax=Deinococcus frigens TaxID=249403 RepID=UPI000497AC28|nr:hypothetical protein [Deinococcus frigens]